MKLLAIEDDQDLLRYLKIGFADEGHELLTAGGPEQVFELIEKHQFDLVILDLGLPNVSGEDLLRSLREQFPKLPILILTAKKDKQGLLDCFKIGCDDFMEKPFIFNELLLRIKAIVRRTSSNRSETLNLTGMDLELNPEQSRVVFAGSEIKLTAKEFYLLEYFLKHPNQIVTRGELLKKIWGYDFDPKTNIVDVHLQSLRSKLGQQKKFSSIKTVRGKGYLLSLDNNF